MDSLSSILIIDDEPEVAFAHQNLVEQLGYKTIVLTDSQQVEHVLQTATDIHMALVDIKMPGLNGLEVLQIIKSRRPGIGVVMATVVNDINHAVTAIKNGAYNYILKPLHVDRIKTVLESYLQNMPRTINSTAAFAAFITQHAQFDEIFRRITSFASTDVPILIEGETGTGKEVIAKAIHSCSPRVSAPYVPVNTAAISKELFNSELFGHKKGAFTGAQTDHLGFFASCGHGTLFLDEIGDLGLDQQKMLLRVLQDNVYTRLGDTTPKSLEARIVFATNKDLKSEVESGSFRDDLYYRISNYSVHLPPLRDRVGDIELLANYFLEKYCAQFGRQIDEFADDTLSALTKYSFPGNVRELEGIVSGAVLIEMTTKIQISSIPEHVLSSRGNSNDLESVKQQEIIRVLSQCEGNQTRAAKILGISRGTLNRWIRDLRNEGIIQ